MASCKPPSIKLNKNLVADFLKCVFLLILKHTNLAVPCAALTVYLALLKTRMGPESCLRRVLLELCRLPSELFMLLHKLAK